MLTKKSINEDVLATITLIAENPNEDEGELVEQLIAQGYDALQAELLIAFVPLGLGRPIIARMAAHPPIHLSDTALIQDYDNHCTFEVRLADVSEFVVASQIGEESFYTGTLSKAQYEAASAFSVELHLITDTLNAGRSIDGAKMAPPILLRLVDTAGFEEWYQRVKPQNFIQRLVAKLKGSLIIASLWFVS